jgi:hydroxypyruvate reductase
VPGVEELLRAAFQAAVEAVQPASCLPAFIPAPGAARTVVVGAGKAAVAMAATLVQHHRAPLTGAVVTTPGQIRGAAPGLDGIEVLEAAHPVPDVSSLRAAGRVLEQLHGLAATDRVIVLLSGGGSALLAQPAAGLTLDDKQSLTRQLLACGATIAEINCVRRKLSAIKGGRLALAAAPAEVIALAISDVPGDVFAEVASGPCSPDPTTLADARDILARYRCTVPPHVRRFLDDDRHETPKPGHPGFARVRETICARSADALAAAERLLAAAQFTPVLLGDAVSAPARELAAEQAQVALDYSRRAGRFALISGGEATVRLMNPCGRGGRNTEYLLALALNLAGAAGISALAADTDGIDGAGDHAGAILTPDSLERARRAGLDPAALLARNCSRDFFAALGDLLVTGATGTNASDLRIILTGCAL